MPLIDEIEFNADLITSDTGNVRHLYCFTWVIIKVDLLGFRLRDSPNVIAKDNVRIESTSNHKRPWSEGSMAIKSEICTHTISPFGTNRYRVSVEQRPKGLFETSLYRMGD